MKANVILVGPFGAGKSSLAKALASGKWPVRYELARMVTSRTRRPGEDGSEYEFVSQSHFDESKDSYWYLQPNRGVAWNYALREPTPLPEDTIRLYVVLPSTATFLRTHLPEKTIVCVVLPPPGGDLRKRLEKRDPTIAKPELDIRVGFIQEDTEQAKAVADIVFYNEEGLEKSAAKLAEKIERFLLGKET